MPNKREFKKYVDAIGASACDEMMAAYYNVKGVDKEAVEKAIAGVLGAVGRAKSNSNVFFDKGVRAFDDAESYSRAKAEFFRKLFQKIAADFTGELDAALKLFNGALPAEVKEQNRKAVAE